MPADIYKTPLASRYASAEMQKLFSDDKKFTTWRRLWIALARAEKRLGLDITDEQIAEMEAHIGDIDYEYAAQMEKELRHDVMAHIHAFGKVCPKAMPIIHLGATSCYVGDNTDIIIMREALELIKRKLAAVIKALADYADKYKGMPALGYTHFQPAQLTTVGKRAALWINELVMDYDELVYRLKTIKLLGSKGATGTQASFMELFGGKHEKVRELERIIAEEMGFPPDGIVPVSGQTYSRKIDANILMTLSGIAQSASKFATDMRLLSHLRECEEPFEEGQVGSSAMPYKRNPMRCERICALARYVITNAQNGALTAGSQWLERTLDDSANRRIAIPEAFLAADAILDIYLNVASGMTPNPGVIARHITKELPFMATENILMRAAQDGGDRQKLHETLRVHSHAAGAALKEHGEKNDLISRIASDPVFNMTEEELEEELEHERFIGRAPEQVEEFLRDIVYPLLKTENADNNAAAAELKF